MFFFLRYLFCSLCCFTVFIWSSIAVICFVVVSVLFMRLLIVCMLSVSFCMCCINWCSIVDICFCDSVRFVVVVILKVSCSGRERFSGGSSMVCIAFFQVFSFMSLFRMFWVSLLVSLWSVCDSLIWSGTVWGFGWLGWTFIVFVNVFVISVEIDFRDFCVRRSDVKGFVVAVDVVVELFMY